MEFTGLPVRGLHIDLKAHTLRPSAMMDIARDAARWGYNTILLEYQDKFPYEGRLAPIRAEDAPTREEIAAFTALCRDLGIRVIPLVQCLAHMHYVLRREAFSDIGETVDALCPSDPRSYTLFCEMASQVLELHPDCEYIHIGGDEARLAAECPRCGDTPKFELLRRHYARCVDFIRSTGRRPILWCDMLLAHPETLDALRGKVVVMDWDYWTTGRPGERARVWGCDVDHPESWSDLHKRLIRPYIYAVEPYVTRPFPYVRFLRDQGFEVLVAPAARCGGDCHFVGQSKHVLNCRESVRAAAEAGALGVVVTSWSVRRVPWPLTENSFVSAAALFRDPGLSDEALDEAFALDSFGAADAELGRMPSLLADAANAAMRVCDLAVIGHQHPYEDIGRPDDYAVRLRASGQTWVHNAAIAPAYAALNDAAEACAKLLERARPADARQALRVDFWRWSLDTARLLAAYAPLLAEERIPRDTAADFIGRFEALGQRGSALLDPLYTPACTPDDYRSRIGIHLEYLRQFV